MCDRWGKAASKREQSQTCLGYAERERARRSQDHRAIKLPRDNEDYKFYMTYLNYAPQIHSSINMYHTSMKRLNRDFRRVIKMRTAMPNEEAVITLIGSVAMEHKPFDRQLPNITTDKSLFPD